MKTAIVVKPGIFTTIQDLGRTGMRKYGIAYAGVMDFTSAINANIMCENPPGSAVLECTYNSPIIKMLRPVVVAVSGVEVDLIVDGKNKKTSVYQAQEGDIIKIDIIKGARGYIAFRGGIDIPLLQHSRSTDTVSNIGGQIIKSETIISCMDEPAVDTHTLLVKPDYQSNTLFIHRGPEFHLLHPQEVDRFTRQKWVVTSKSNRMSFLLDGSPIKLNPHHMLSGPVLPGTIQLPQSGLPIILGNDSQTTGGYARIGIVEARSYQILTQKMPGERINLSLLEE